MTRASIALLAWLSACGPAVTPVHAPTSPPTVAVEREGAPPPEPVVPEPEPETLCPAIAIDVSIPVRVTSPEAQRDADEAAARERLPALAEDLRAALADPAADSFRWYSRRDPVGHDAVRDGLARTRLFTHPVCITALRSLSLGARAEMGSAVVTLSDGEGPLGTMSLGLHRDRDVRYRIVRGGFGDALLALVELRHARRSRAALQAITARYTTFDSAVTRANDGARELLCFEPIDGTVASRCFENVPSGRLRSGGHDVAVSFAIEGHREPDGCYVISDWDAPPLYRLDCESDAGLPADLAETTMPPAIAGLGEVEVRRRTGGVELSSSELHVVCTDDACSEPFVDDEAILTECDTITAAGAWVVAECLRLEEPGAEVRVSATGLRVFGRDGDVLLPQGMIPFGNEALERVEHDPDAEITIWEGTTLGHAGFTLGEDGCVTVGPAHAAAVTIRNGHRRERARRGTGERAADRLTGEPLPSVYDEIDSSGAWRPDGASGFRRVASCEVPE